MIGKDAPQFVLTIPLVSEDVEGEEGSGRGVAEGQKRRALLCCNGLFPLAAHLPPISCAATRRLALIPLVHLVTYSMLAVLVVVPATKFSRNARGARPASFSDTRHRHVTEHDTFVPGCVMPCPLDFKELSSAKNTMI